MAALAEMKHEWRMFKGDRPGERFENHRRRMDNGPAWRKVVFGVAGVVLVAVGIVFCVLPGPGSVGIVFGLALLAGMSRSVARVMDRAEPKLRRVARRIVRFWRTRSLATRITLIGASVIVTGFVAFVAWRHWFG